MLKKHKHGCNEQTSELNTYSVTYFTIFKHPIVSLYDDELTVCLRPEITSTNIDGILYSVGLKQLQHLHISNTVATVFNTVVILTVVFELKNTLQSSRLHFSLNLHFHIFVQLDSQQSTPEKKNLHKFAKQTFRLLAAVLPGMNIQKRTKQESCAKSEG